MPNTHLYMPGLGPYDKQSQRAAISEMYNNGSAGTLFVDTPEAKTKMSQQYQGLLESRLARDDLKHGERDRLKKALDDRKEYNRIKQKLAGDTLSPLYRAGLRAKMNRLDNIKVVDANAGPKFPAYSIQTGDADKLIVLGHGSPNSNQGISTRMDVSSEPQDFDNHDAVTVTKGRKILHPSREIAQRIQTISRMQLATTGYQALDVRMVACGGANTFRTDAFDDQMHMGSSLIQSITDDLDTLNAHPQIQVSGFMGDTNSSQPQAYKDHEHKVFTSRIKQRRDSSTQSDDFKERVGKMRARANTDPVITTTPIKKFLRKTDYASDNSLSHFVDNFNGPSMADVSAKMQTRAKPFTTVSQTTGSKPLAYVPRVKTMQTEHL